MYVPRSVTVAAVVGALTLSACGASSGDDAAQVPDTTFPEAAAVEASPPPDTAEAPAPAASESATTTPPEAAPEADDAPVTTGSQPDPEPQDTTTVAPVTDAPTTGPAPAELGGRAFADTLATTSDTATNPLPDLVVDDVRRGTKVNLRNIFPADRPVLIWMWAPH